jgi:hypothetical protein
MYFRVVKLLGVFCKYYTYKYHFFVIYVESPSDLEDELDRMNYSFVLGLLSCDFVLSTANFHSLLI